jgi:hypothetical protein
MQFAAMQMKKVTITISEAHFDQLRQLAKASHRSVRGQVAHLVEQTVSSNQLQARSARKAAK